MNTQNPTPEEILDLLVSHKLDPQYASQFILRHNIAYQKTADSDQLAILFKQRFTKRTRQTEWSAKIVTSVNFSVNAYYPGDPASLYQALKNGHVPHHLDSYTNDNFPNDDHSN